MSDSNGITEMCDRIYGRGDAMIFGFSFCTISLKEPNLFWYDRRGYGIAGKYISGATVEKLSESPEEVCVRVLEKGDLICSADRKILVIRQDGQKALAEQTGDVQMISGCRSGEILQITLE